METEIRKIAALSYVPLLSIVCLWGRNEPLVRFHARQALVIHILCLIWLFLPWIALTVLLELGCFVLLVMGFYYAASGVMYDLPVAKELLNVRIGPKHGRASALLLYSSARGSVVQW
ncbi:hypothetical protein KBB08_04410 [Candidatus Gracilibacteria bacterium]|nr:hypothetical protein [Candidatus Gracilibacteria bacterium]